MDANPSIKASRFEQPQVLPIMLALRQFHDRLKILLCLIRILYDAVVDFLHLLNQIGLILLTFNYYFVDDFMHL